MMKRIVLLGLGALLLFACFNVATEGFRHNDVSVKVENQAFNDANVRLYCNGALRKTMRQVTNTMVRDVRLASCSNVTIQIGLIGSRETVTLRNVPMMTKGDTLHVVVGPTINLSTFWISPGGT